MFNSLPEIHWPTFFYSLIIFMVISSIWNLILARIRLNRAAKQVDRMDKRMKEMMQQLKTEDEKITEMAKNLKAE